MAETALAAYRSDLLRPAAPNDAGPIYALTRPLQESGNLRAREREHIKAQINDFFVIERDCAIVACAALHPYFKEGVGELACIATRPDSQEGGLGHQLLEQVEKTAAEKGLSTLFAISTRAVHWFLARGFQVGNASLLPPPARKMPRACQEASILFKSLG